MNKLTPGTAVTVKVARKADFGYFLSNGTEEVMLHKSEALKQHEENDEVTVFLYQDHEGRIAATESMPKVRLDSLAWLDAAGINKKYGTFLNMGIKKDVLLSKDDLPHDWELWPQAGDKVYAGLKLDKKGRLFADLATEEEMVEQAEAAGEEMVEQAEAAGEELLNKQLEGYVYKLNDSGVLLFTDDKLIGFIHRDEMTRKLRLGEKVSARVSYVREDGRINMSMKPRKELAYSEDAEKIVSFLRKNKGQMGLTDKSSPSEIEEVFHISKAAFKRAMGKLLKEDKVVQENGKTFLKI
ncbi:S1 RNA-binding domain-containing protein [Fictibacillus aquaticus]|uniref:DNA-binding protein n=1 Tax=Fictibacillus aquaticus TaxID=2021314 RepID=A0A235FCN4_9BACL|nr:S1-like domain-containing RNA-binding protein [Fictibacillus aquaticus]OYD58693.1 DNA-binding protein [Fictibacillus aquaticus]